MKILIFLHGTVIMHRSGLGKTREERVVQCIKGEESIRDYANYVPIDNAVNKIQDWVQDGYEVLYLSSHENPSNVDKDIGVLKKFNFPLRKVYYRQNGESYGQVIERIMPDILIEDDCESMGGDPEVAYQQIHPSKQAHIKSIIVKEFEGIDGVKV